SAWATDDGWTIIDRGSGRTGTTCHAGADLAEGADAAGPGSQRPFRGRQTAARAVVSAARSSEDGDWHMRAPRFFLPAMLAAALVPLSSGPASAAPPGNDESAGAVALHLGDRVEQDTTQATTNAGDDALNANCGAPATNASVWYTYSPSVRRNVVLDTTASSYSAGLMVFRGAPKADSLVACGPGAVGLRARAGRTYYVMAFSDTDVIGGDLVLTLQNAPTPRVHVTLAKRGGAVHGRAAKVHGTAS